MAETDPDRKQDRDALLSVEELAAACGLRTCIVHRLVTLEVISPETPGTQPVFTHRTVRSLRKMRRLHVELGVSWTSMPLVMQLLDRIDDLERRLR